eukprot:scaffold229494_cov10-Tisochrysis_lutea.AAC.1
MNWAKRKACNLCGAPKPGRVAAGIAVEVCNLQASVTAVLSEQKTRLSQNYQNKARALAQLQ